MCLAGPEGVQERPPEASGTGTPPDPNRPSGDGLPASQWGRLGEGLYPAPRCMQRDPRGFLERSSTGADSGSGGALMPPRPAELGTHPRSSQFHSVKPDVVGFFIIDLDCPSSSTKAKRGARATARGRARRPSQGGGGRHAPDLGAATRRRRGPLSRHVVRLNQGA